MKSSQRIGWILAIAVLALTVWTLGPTVAQNVVNYMEQGGARWVVGGSLDVVSGGDLDIESGGTLKLAGTSVNNLVIGVGSSYKLARGTVTLDGSNPSQVSHGLTTVVACTVSIQSDNLTTDPTQVSYVISAGNLNVYAWKPTSPTSTTLTASTNSAVVVAWACIGT